MDKHEQHANDLQVWVDAQSAHIASLTEAVRVLSEALEKTKAELEYLRDRDNLGGWTATQEVMLDDISTALTTAKELTK